MMYLKVWRDPVLNSLHAALTITEAELQALPLTSADRRFLREIEEGPKISERLFSLATIAMRVEEVNK